ncbi:hypothetical protein D3C81_1589560 [compost metagenome]
MVSLRDAASISTPPFDTSQDAAKAPGLPHTDAARSWASDLPLDESPTRWTPPPFTPTLASKGPARAQQTDRISTGLPTHRTAISACQPSAVPLLLKMLAALPESWKRTLSPPMTREGSTNAPDSCHPGLPVVAITKSGDW